MTKKQREAKGKKVGRKRYQRKNPARELFQPIRSPDQLIAFADGVVESVICNTLGMMFAEIIRPAVRASLKNPPPVERSPVTEVIQ